MLSVAQVSAVGRDRTVKADSTQIRFTEVAMVLSVAD